MAKNRKRLGDSIRVTLDDGKRRQFPAGTTVGEIVQSMENGPGDACCAALVNGQFADLQTPLHESGRLQLIPIDSRDGHRMYQRSLTFILLAALRDIYPDLRLNVRHSLCKGLYCELLSDRYKSIDRVVLTRADLGKIGLRMQEWIQKNAPFVRQEVTIERARRTFLRHGHPEKADLIRYRKDKRISLYKLGRYREHFCGYLLPRTGCVKKFELRLHPPGFILRYPEDGHLDELPPFVDNPKMFHVFLEYGQWCHILGLDTVAQLNKVAAAGEMADFVKINEALHEKKIAQIADLIQNSPTGARVVLIAGPSASGKTTSAKRLAIQLRVNGYQPLIISLDDYFHDRARTPRDETGEYDFETIKAIDIRLFNQQIRKLMSGKSVMLPHFNFITGKRAKGRPVRMAKNGIVLVEGIHAFNRELTASIPEGLKFKLYISALTQLNLDSLNRVPTSDTRLIRRIVRDSRCRGYSAADTLARWPSVRRGEERNIFPYQEDADVIFNSALIYEYAALKTYAERALKRVGPRNPTYPEARRMLYLLSYFLPVETDDIPSWSILREFIGKSSFQ